MLPIQAVRERIISQLECDGRLVLAAPTGSGKTTQTPQILLESGLARRQILVLQPRRLAARGVARRVAAELGAEVGELVGYQTRNDSRVSARTRIRFVTDGIFARLLQSSPDLDTVDAVLIDEFHERRLATDLALALACRLQQRSRPDLKLMVMSATLDAAAVASRLQCQTVETTERLHPIDIHYRSTSGPVWERAAAALAELLTRGAEGDVLAFMPGAYEIRRTIEAMQQAVGRAGISELLTFLPLHGSLSPRQQDAALAESGNRKIIVATNVAETSITIPGVCHVIDSGLARQHRHDPNRGIDVLLVGAISRASAQQRCGRAGRTAPGHCIRLWSEIEHDSRPELSTPEIVRLDLSDVLLQLAALGIDAAELAWLEPPAPAAIARAHNLLTGLGATRSDGSLTEIGVGMAKLPMHPRLARLLVEASRRRCLDRATLWAALNSERSLRSGKRSGAAETGSAPTPDAESDVEVLEGLYWRAVDLGFAVPACEAAGIAANAAREVQAAARLYRDRAGAAGLAGGQRSNHCAGHSVEDLVKCLLVAYFDRVAVRRDGGNLLCAMSGQQRVELDRQSRVQRHILVALDVRELEAIPRSGPAAGSAVRTVLSLVSGVEPEWLEELLPEHIAETTEVDWNDAEQAIESHLVVRYDGLAIRRQPSPEIDAEAAETLLVDYIERGETTLGGWDEEVEEWINRTRLLAALYPERNLLRYDSDDLRLLRLEIVAGATRASHLRKRPCLHHVQNALSWNDQEFVRQMAPTRLLLPSGRRMRIHYGRPDTPPRGRAVLQDLYDLQATPTVAGGRQKLLIEILGPNFRPVQVTDDLAGFWRTTYPEVKKELKRRYPKHEWR